MMPIMRTTIDINDALLKELRERAQRRGRPFRQELEVVLKRGLAAGQGEREPVRLKTHAVGIKAAYRGMSMNQLYDQVEAEGHQRVAEE